jgi:hypothetical protein
MLLRLDLAALGLRHSLMVRTEVHHRALELQPLGAEAVDSLSRTPPESAAMVAPVVVLDSLQVTPLALVGQRPRVREMMAEDMRAS